MARKRCKLPSTTMPGQASVRCGCMTSPWRPAWDKPDSQAGFLAVENWSLQRQALLIPPWVLGLVGQPAPPQS